MGRLYMKKRWNSIYPVYTMVGWKLKLIKPLQGIKKNDIIQMTTFIFSATAIGGGIDKIPGNRFFEDKNGRQLS